MALIRLLIATILLLLVGMPETGTTTAVAAYLDPDRAASTADVWTGTLADSNVRQEVPSDVQPTPTPPTTSEPTQRLIVRFEPRSGRSAQQDAHQSAGAVQVDALALPNTVRVEVPASTASSALASYNNRSDVVYAEPDYLAYALETPNDPGFGSQWGMQRINAASAWDVTHASANIRVAIVDCGIFSDATGRLGPDGQPGHQDLRGKVVANNNFTTAATGFDDFCNHGTHVAGIAAAATNNSLGVAGLGYNVSLINAKVLNDSGSGFTSDIANGILWSTDSGAKVINLSLGRDGSCSNTENAAVSYAWQRGVVVVAAAGNSGSPQAGAPGNCPNVVAVAAVDQNDNRASFSNYGNNVEVAAPGVGILSTTRDGSYQSFNGTSMAAPHVAGLAGLLWSLNPGGSPQSIVDRISAGAVRIGGTGSLWAWGRIDAAASVRNGSAPQPAPQPAPTPQPTPVVCQNPRQPVRLTSTQAGPDSQTLTIQAGAGTIHQVDLREVRNLSVDVGSQRGVTAPIVYTPTSATSSVALTITQVSVGTPTHVSLVVTDDCGPWPTFFGSGGNGFQRAALNGTVRDATTSSPISGAVVTVRGAQRSASTDANGAFSLADLPVGAQMLDVSAGSYTSETQAVTLQANQTASVSYALTPSQVSGDLSISVSWGASPSDLDAHLSGPLTNGQRFHLYWGAPGAASHVSLVGDARSGFGPERVVIKVNPGTGRWVAGAYRFWVHNFSGTPGFSGSSGTVTVSRSNQELGSYVVSGAGGTSTLPLWQVVTANVDADGHVTLAPVQQFLSGSSGTMLRFEDGSDGALEWPSTKQTSH
jgi:thermitase